MRLTYADVEGIARKATEKYMKETKRIFAEVSEAFGLLMYAKLANEKTFKLVAKLPEEWKFPNNQITVRFPDGSRSLRLVLNIPSSPFPPRYNYPELTGEEAIKAKAIFDEEARIDKQERVFYGEVLAFVNQFKSLAKLASAWPEGKEFYDRPEVESNRQQLITLPKAINAKLGLK